MTSVLTSLLRSFGVKVCSLSLPPSILPSLLSLPPLRSGLQATSQSLQTPGEVLGCWRRLQDVMGFLGEGMEVEAKS